MTPSTKISPDYLAFQNKEGFFVNRNAGVLQMSGSDRLGFLHNFCTADIKALLPGQSTEAFVLDPKGKTLFFIEVFAEKDHLNLLIPRAQLQQLADHLTRYVIVEDVQLNSRENAQVVYASWKFEKAFPTHLGGSAYCCIFSDQDSLDAWRNESAITELSPELFELLRIESQFPLSGIDVLEENLAQEFERDATAISYNKGCYLGQETVARLDALGHTNRSFRVAGTLDDQLPDLSQQLICEGKPCGKATSMAWSPKYQSYLVLIMVKKPFHQPDQELFLGDQPLKILN